MKNKQNAMLFWLYFFIISYVEVSKYNKQEPGKLRAKLFFVEKAFATGRRKCNVNCNDLYTKINNKSYMRIWNAVLISRFRCKRKKSHLQHTRKSILFVWLCAQRWEEIYPLKISLFKHKFTTCARLKFTAYFLCSFRFIVYNVYPPGMWTFMSFY